MNKKMTIVSVMGLFALVAGMMFNHSAKAEEVGTQVCLIEGYVRLTYVTSDWIEGYVGDKEVGFAYYQDLIYGNIEGHNAKLHEMRNSTITGNIGGYTVTWNTDGKHIFGYQKCIPAHKFWRE